MVTLAWIIVGIMLAGGILLAAAMAGAAWLGVSAARPELLDPDAKDEPAGE